MTLLSIGYAVTNMPAMVGLAPNLAKIGFLLVLGGLAVNFLPTRPVAPESKEGGHD